VVDGVMAGPARWIPARLRVDGAAVAHLEHPLVNGSIGGSRPSTLPLLPGELI
jgi:hypothetical protein